MRAGVAFHTEKLAVLNADERKQLGALLHKLHENFEDQPFN